MLLKKINTNLKFGSAYHPQTNGQTEVVNCSLGNLLCCLVGDNIKSWDQKLCQAEFAHNHAVNRNTGFSPSQIVYAVILCDPLDLLPLPKHTKVHGNVPKLVTSYQKVHATVRHHLENTNQRYKAAADKQRRNCGFQEGDLVWVILRKEHFPANTYNKLSARKIGPLPIIKKNSLQQKGQFATTIAAKILLQNCQKRCSKLAVNDILCPAAYLPRACCNFTIDLPRVCVMATYLLAYKVLNPQPLHTNVKPLTNMITYLIF
jgi:hypothetical protein